MQSKTKKVDSKYEYEAEKVEYFRLSILWILHFHVTLHFHSTVLHFPYLILFHFHFAGLFEGENSLDKTAKKEVEREHEEEDGKEIRGIL